MRQGMSSTDILAYYRWAASQPLTIVDVETTGYPNARNRVIEVSVLQASLADGILMQRTDLINPEQFIPGQIVRFTGITQTMVDGAAIAAEVLPNYWTMLNQGVLTAHNLSFDYRFLQIEFQRLGMKFACPATRQLCTVKLSRLMLPELPSRSLPNLVRHFRFNVGRSHRAEADTLACWLLAQRLLTEIMNEDDDVLLARFAWQQRANGARTQYGDRRLT